MAPDGVGFKCGQQRVRMAHKALQVEFKSVFGHV
jgi:hypothetical protein